jgi:hypothetical protein
MDSRVLISNFVQASNWQGHALFLLSATTLAPLWKNLTLIKLRRKQEIRSEIMDCVGEV